MRISRKQQQRLQQQLDFLEETRKARVEEAIRFARRMAEEERALSATIRLVKELAGLEKGEG